MFRKVCTGLGAILLAMGLLWGAFNHAWLWAVLPAFVLMAIGGIKVTDDE